MPCCAQHRVSFGMGMMVGMVASGFLFLVAGLFAIGLAINAVWRAVMAPAGLPREAGCGSCGYELTTFEGGRCSECGADLLKAGVNTRRNAVRTAGSVPAALMGWSLLVMVVGVVIMYTVSMVAMTSSFAAAPGGVGGMSYASTYTYAPGRLPRAADGTRQATPPFMLEIDLDVVGTWGTSPTSGTITYTLEANDQQAVIEIADAGTEAWVLTGPDGQELASGQYLQAKDVQTALDAIGLDESAHELIPAYATEIVSLADMVAQDPFSYESTYSMAAMNGTTGMGGSTNSNSTVRLTQISGSANYGAMAGMMGSGSSADYIVPVLVFGVGFVVWIGGVIFIIRRRAKLLAQPRL